MKLGRRALTLLGFSLCTLPSGFVFAEGEKGDKKPEAPQPFFAEISVLHATNEKKGIDERIGDMPELKNPPFSSYDSYTLLDRQKLPLVKNDPKRLKLPNGR